MKRKPKIGEVGSVDFVVEDRHAIQLLDEGLPPVLSTPWLIWYLEHAARIALSPVLDEGESTVGVQVDVKHMAATPVGHLVRCQARVIHADGRVVSLQVEAHDENELIARGMHKRSVINAAKFAKRVERKTHR